MSTARNRPNPDFADLVARWDDEVAPRLSPLPVARPKPATGASAGDATGAAAPAEASGEAAEFGIAWLQEALDAAIKLEFSTIPPYLAALWSIRDQSAPAALSIRRIVQEEMLHMALACNMLVGIGGTPKIAEPGFAPVYPGELAGGVHPGLTVGLEGLSDRVLQDFMVIELPEVVADETTAPLREAAGVAFDGAGHETIGRFYARLQTTFEQLDPPFAMDRQISGPLAWFPVRDLHDLREAIDLIKHQGEGSDRVPVEYEDNTRELAHFYRFLEVYARKRIAFRPDASLPGGGIWGFGEPIERPDTWPMARVPAGGWPEEGQAVSAEVQKLLDTFDRRYTLLLTQLGAVWADGDQGKLIQAIETMFTLEEPARALMQIPIPGRDDGATFGPCFRFRPELLT